MILGGTMGYFAPTSGEYWKWGSHKAVSMKTVLQSTAFLQMLV